MLWAAVLWVTPALLGGCGDADDDHATQQATQPRLTHEQYQDAMLRILRSEDSRAASGLYTETVARAYDTAECSAKVREFHGHLVSIVEEVDDLTPPSDAADAQREFLVAARESVRLVGVAADDVGTGRLRCGEPLNARIYGMPSTIRAEAAIATLEERGYVVFGD